MKILTITGTRPELIRLSVIMNKLDYLNNVVHLHVYTNQNHDVNLSTIFFDDLKIRKPDYYFNSTNSLGEFLSNGFLHMENILSEHKPDKVLVLGDTNSALFAILAAKKGIPVYHMEAGNRCYDGDVPEETNRKIVDACSLYNLPYTENSKTNLINEGFHKNFVFKTGNPIWEVLRHYQVQIDSSCIMQKLGRASWEEVGFEYKQEPYVLLTFHRTENVDNPQRVKKVIAAMKEVVKNMPVIYPVHPRSKDQFEKQGVDLSGITTINPIGFFDFVKLERLAKVVFTDSGTVPEETSLFHIPCIVLRNTTERQELMENGSLILAGTETEDILQAFSNVLNNPIDWKGLPDYDKLNVSDTVINILLGQKHNFERKGHDEY